MTKLNSLAQARLIVLEGGAEDGAAGAGVGEGVAGVDVLVVSSSGRISKWAVEVGALNIDFKPRTAIKSQALVDLMAEWRENLLLTPTERPEHWVMYFDDSLKLEGAGEGVLLISSKGKQLKYILYIFWKVSNNEAEYEALLHGLCLAISLGIKRLLVYGDSAVVINQVKNPWDRNKENMDAYCLEVRKLENKFYGLEFHHVVRVGIC
jgi:hypothetical protein